MSKRGKRPGLRARSKNARAPKALNAKERESVVVSALLAMHFRDVADGTPDEGNLVLVRLKDSTFRFGMVLMGRFANYEPNAGEFVTFAHSDRITHWMRIIPPVVRSDAQVEPFEPADDTSPPSIMETALAAGGIEDAGEDQYR